jgi:hypothetical protein
LQEELQEQTTDANQINGSTQQSVLDSSSRELTFQLKELERMQLQTQIRNSLLQ